MEKLLFANPVFNEGNPVFNEGKNLTVRKGNKWKDRLGKVIIENINNPTRQLIGEIYLTESKTLTLLKSESYKLLHEHDPNCKYLNGLRDELKRVYGDISDEDEITLVWFKIL